MSDKNIIATQDAQFLLTFECYLADSVTRRIHAKDVAAAHAMVANVAMGLTKKHDWPDLANCHSVSVERLTWERPFGVESLRKLVQSYRDEDARALTSRALEEMK